MLKSSLFVYIDAPLYVKETITIRGAGTDVAAARADKVAIELRTVHKLHHSNR